MILISQFNAVVDRNNLKMNKQAHDSTKTQHDYQDIIDAQRINFAKEFDSPWVIYQSGVELQKFHSNSSKKLVAGGVETLI